MVCITALSIDVQNAEGVNTDAENAEGVNKCQPRVVSTLGTKTKSDTNAESVR